VTNHWVSSKVTRRGTGGLRSTVTFGIMLNIVNWCEHQKICCHVIVTQGRPTVKQFARKYGNLPQGCQMKISIKVQTVLRKGQKIAKYICRPTNFKRNEARFLKLGLRKANLATLTCPWKHRTDMSELQAHYSVIPKQWTWLFCSVSVIPSNKLHWKTSELSCWFQVFHMRTPMVTSKTWCPLYSKSNFEQANLRGLGQGFLENFGS